MQAKTWAEVEDRIKEAVAAGWLIDKRSEMPRGVQNGKTLSWPERKLEDVLGVVIHQSAGVNAHDPKETARYHTSVENHITPGRPLPSLVYQLVIIDTGEIWLCGDLSWRTYAQAADDKDYPGDENTHLLALLVLGGFAGLGWRPKWAKDNPTTQQMQALPVAVSWLQDVFGFGGEGVFGHYHFGKAACPGFVLTSWVEACRARDDKAELVNTKEVQEALLRWCPSCLPKWGPDGEYGAETRTALRSFQKVHGIRQTGREDPFTELLLLQRYPDPALVNPVTTLEADQVVQDSELSFNITKTTVAAGVVEDVKNSINTATDEAASIDRRVQVQKPRKRHKRKSKD